MFVWFLIVLWSGLIEKKSRPQQLKQSLPKAKAQERAKQKQAALETAKLEINNKVETEILATENVEQVVETPAVETPVEQGAVAE